MIRLAPTLRGMVTAAARSPALPAPLPVHPIRRALHSSSSWRAMRNVTGSTGAPPNMPPRPPTMTPPSHDQTTHPSFASSQPPPPPHFSGGAADSSSSSSAGATQSPPHPAFAPPNMKRLTRVLLVLWGLNIVVTVMALTPPELSEEEQRSKQQERAAARALRWRSPEDDLQLQHLMQSVDERCDEMQRTLTSTAELTQASRPLLPFVAVVEVLLRLQVVCALNRIVEQRTLQGQVDESRRA